MVEEQREHQSDRTAAGNGDGHGLRGFQGFLLPDGCLFVVGLVKSRRSTMASGPARPDRRKRLFYGGLPAGGAASPQAGVFPGGKPGGAKRAPYNRFMSSTSQPAAAGDAPGAIAADPGIEALLEGLPATEHERVLRARAFALDCYGGKVLGTGEPAMAHAIGLTQALVALRLDAETRAAGLLFHVPACLPDSGVVLEAQFGTTVAGLVAGVARLNSMRVVTRGLDNQGLSAEGRRSQAEVLRKMLLAMVGDIRVVLLRLASRTQSLRALSAAPEAERRAVAQETLDIYAPLANRLGVWQLKWEMEDLSFRYLHPEEYKAVARKLDETRGAREDFIAGVERQLGEELAAAGIKAEISGRPKHLYSIWNKMRAKGLDFEGLFDLRGLRVLVDDVKDCYAALGIVHNLWTPIPREFDDYISRPKANDYRSLHTAVTGPDGRGLEVQIRTHDMHRHAELGVAAHWKYKEGARQDANRAQGDAFDQKIAWLRQVLAWRDDIVDASDWVAQSKQAALDDTVYVLTPQGRVVDLPAGSTPVDFAYALHTDIGHRCRGARVDGQMVPLDTRLANGQRVEIISAKNGGPSRDWLNPALGLVGSSRARHKVRQWFNSQALEQTIANGRAVVEREMQREGRTGVNLDELAGRFDMARAEDLFAAVGRDEIGTRALQTALRGDGDAAEQAAPAEQMKTHESRADDPGSGILVVGVDRLMTQLARCCKPAPPDGIIGFVTRGRGISIHRASCASAARLRARQPERIIAADWGRQTSSVFPVDVVVRAEDRHGLLRDVSEVLSREKINVTAANTQSRNSVATMHFTLDIADVGQLRRVLAQVRDVPGVQSAVRR
jgi:GTP pyrophosphokinase